MYAGSAYDADEVMLKADGAEANMNGRGPCNVEDYGLMRTAIGRFNAY